MADYVTADVINVQCEGIAQESSLISGQVSTPCIDLSNGFHIDRDGLHYSTAGTPTPIVAINARGVGIQEMFGNDATTAKCVSECAEHTADDDHSIVTSRDVIACCSRAHPLTRFASDIVRTKRISIRDHINIPVTFARACQVRTIPAPIIVRDNSSVTLPPADINAGTMIEYIPCAGIIDAVIIATNGDQYHTCGQSITFVSDGTQWFALDANGLKYIC